MGKMIEKQNLAADACSLIYLYHCDILRYATRGYSLFITPGILEELSRKASGKELQTYYSITQVKKISHSLNIPDISKNVSKNDQSLIELFYQEGYDAILSEDGKILQYCKKNNIQHFCSLSLVCGLVKNKVLSYDQALLRFEFLKECGRYAPWVLEEAYSMLALSNQA